MRLILSSLLAVLIASTAFAGPPRPPEFGSQRPPEFGRNGPEDSSHGTEARSFRYPCNILVERMKSLLDKPVTGETLMVLDGMRNYCSGRSTALQVLGIPKNDPNAKNKERGRP